MKNSNDIPLRPQEVAKELAVSTDAVLALIHSGEMLSFQPGRYTYRVLRSDLEAFKRAHTTSEGWPFEPDYSGSLLTVKQVAQEFPELSESHLRGWVERGVLRGVKIHRMIRLFPETMHGLKYGFPATTTKKRAREARRSSE